MQGLHEFISSHAQDELVSWQIQREAAMRFGVTVHEVEKYILDQGYLPARYQRNRQTISLEDQRRLCNSRVTVIGCGGLGGYVLEELARLGVGEIVAVDHDVFEEHNLNRQVLATVEQLGRNKADVAAERMAAVNPAVRIITYKEAFSQDNGLRILEGSHVAVDALDRIQIRLLLSSFCRDLGIPLVHGAICGWFGQVTTQYPGDNTLEVLYRSCTQDRGMETTYGNPSFTPAVIASLQVAEVCKVLVERGQSLRRRVLALNLLDMELEELHL